ncbi:hypothetical protein BJ322DRAFT_620786 [Thelephora terrestris]|uniref:Uncharacterized protein n=1 Tax=Thelephora terrestris TaxID=56493 RepID=A0A9P6HKN0_9AGAM|nr:hypothetical protein BJ322DRAFT_620786 [Thelephora terrestris]
MASQAKDRHSAQLARSLTEFNQTVTQTKFLLDQFSSDLDAMRTLTAIHVSQFMTVATDMDTGAWRNDNGTDQVK